ncbi:hypothetical protein PspLS_10045 [Pyricularia sp. CBS 133598]|nr:hypothetical protein PspLS_10045 [Pyricularia sp. CBS 133598]
MHCESVQAPTSTLRAVSFDLMKITFGDHAGGDETEELLKLTHNMSFTWNKNAPIYPTQEDVASFEQKPRIRAYRAEYARFKVDPSPEAQKQANRVQSRISKSINIFDSEDEEDQLRRQVARTNQELHEQTLRATQLQEELQALRASANVTLTPFDGRERLRLNPPATFDGTPGQFKGYLVQVRTYQAFHLEIFRSETEKVVHAATFLRGRALSWFEPLLQEWFDVPPEERR